MVEASSPLITPEAKSIPSPAVMCWRTLVAVILPSGTFVHVTAAVRSFVSVVKYVCKSDI